MRFFKIYFFKHRNPLSKFTVQVIKVRSWYKASLW